MFGFNIFTREFVAFWVILALINSGLAQTKNKDGFTWFIISAFVGPIATLLIVISQKEYEEEEG